MNLSLHIIVEIIAFLVSIICYQTIKDTPLKWFIPFLFGIVCLEIVAYYMAFTLKMHTVKLYNISMPIEYSFYAFIIYKYLQGPIIKKVALFLVVFTLAFSAINLAFIQGFSSFNTRNQQLGIAVVIFCCCAFFVDLFRREEEINLFREPMFWIVTGVLLFNTGELSSILFSQFIRDNPNPSYPTFLYMIIKILVYILYSFISIGLLCTRKPYQTMSDKSSLSAY